MGKVSRLARTVLALGSLAWAVGVAGSVSAQQGRIGWHGEEMPEGLVKAGKEGEYRWEKDSAIMVYVPPGTFPMGSAEGDPDERPVHEVYLDGYYIDKYEVSWGQWKLSGLPYSERIGERRPRPEPPDWGIIDDQPMLNTSWYDAKKYVEWAGKRLPTEAEWEKAARGTDGRVYPWGSEASNFEQAIWKDHPIALESTAPVTCCASGVSPYGVHNLAGNVYEWCEDVYHSRFYSQSPRRNPVYLGSGRHRVLRGGAFVLELEDLRSALRYRLLPEDRAPYIGFRTVLSQGDWEPTVVGSTRSQVPEKTRQAEP